MPFWDIPKTIGEAGSMSFLLQDSIRTVHSAVDSVVDKTLLPDPVIPIIQWTFQRPPWVMWGGVLLAAAIAGLILRWLWPRRQKVFGWLCTRSRGLKAVMVGGVCLVVLLAVGLGFKSYHFVETDRRFCAGCHIFISSGQAWEQPDTGYYSLVPELEGKHDTLSCHACHVLRPVKEAVKLVLWMSGVRGEEIPPHAKVPRATCEGCHVTGAAKETWQAIAATAGHRTHLESDSSALKGKVECLTCHARTAHRFLPADTTCVQKGCHLTDDTRINLGRMSGQSELHCTVCHKFTKPVAALATRDSAAGALRPDFRQCLSCHQMKEQLSQFSLGRDPHIGTCGMCHDPHTQVKPADAMRSCSNAQCHNNWRDVAFHAGATHRRVARNCTLCHQPHAARVDASDCRTCHERVRGSVTGPGRHAEPPVPFDTLKALERSAAPPPPAREPRGKGDAPPDVSAARFLPPLAVDSFEHDRHKTLACTTCHDPASKKSKLTFEAPRGCQICHHQAASRSDCVSCHAASEMAAPHEIEVSLTPAGRSPRARTLGFNHDRHQLPCSGCHVAPVTLTVADSVATCRGCHEQHHTEARDCAGCHRAAVQVSKAHGLPDHEGCAACHTAPLVRDLQPARNFCLACHEVEQDHYKGEECAACHLQSDPAAFKSRLASALERP
jgi:hypothetical protein